jgi:ABC-type nitrate/sulfonate/bicarbonate transport system ATPase subunit
MTTDASDEQSLGGKRGSVEVRGVSKSFADSRTNNQRIVALQDVNMLAAAGELISIIGPSGCGKSTLFSLIAGLETPDSGVITTKIDGLEHDGNSVAYMPQKDLLFPWRSVLRNITLPLEIRGVPRKDAIRRAASQMSIFGLEGFENSYPFHLSGGMRQRAALFRTVIQDRPIMLLDEPFGALDSFTRADMQLFLLNIWERFNRTIILITHDVQEAIFVSDRVYVMSPRPGRVVQSLTDPLPRPRHLEEVITSSAFTELETELLTLLGRTGR